MWESEKIKRIGKIGLCKKNFGCSRRGYLRRLFWQNENWRNSGSVWFKIELKLVFILQGWTYLSWMKILTLEYPRTYWIYPTIEGDCWIHLKAWSLACYRMGTYYHSVFRPITWCIDHVILVWWRMHIFK